MIKVPDDIPKPPGPTFGVSKRSQLTGDMNTLEFPSEHHQDIAEWILRNQQNDPTLDMIQVMLPMLTVDQREFLMTGITPEEWKSIWEDEE